MEITEVRIIKITGGKDGRLKGYATITLDDSFVIHNIKIVEGLSAGVFVAMPSRKTRAGEYKDIAHPITQEFRDKLTQKILDKYAEATVNQEMFKDNQEYYGL